MIAAQETALLVSKLLLWLVVFVLAILGTAALFDRQRLPSETHSDLAPPPAPPASIHGVAAAPRRPFPPPPSARNSPTEINYSSASAHLEPAGTSTAVSTLASDGGGMPERPDVPALNMPGADLQGTELTDLDYRHANLSGADLAHTKLRNLDLSNADLSDTGWYHALVKDTVLRGAVMRNADVRGSHFSRADLRGADLRDLNAASTTVDGKRYGMSMTDSDLRDADLRGADMSAALLWGTDFGGADLRGANFRGAAIVDKRCVAIRVVHPPGGAVPSTTRTRVSTQTSIPLRRE